MESNKKYYYKNYISFNISLFLFILIFFSMGVSDLLKDDTSSAEILVSWAIVIIFGILSILMLIIVIQVNRKVGYIELLDDNLSLKPLLGKIKTAPLKGKYEFRQRKDDIKFIVLYGVSTKPLLIVGSGFGISLNDLKKKIEIANQEETKTQN